MLGAGDLIGASLFNSAVQNDQPTIDVLNELCLNASSVGNHEFDKGYADLTGRVINGAPGTAPDPCPLDGQRFHARRDQRRCGVPRRQRLQKGTQTPALPEYTTFTVNGITVGVIGAVTARDPSTRLAGRHHADRHRRSGGGGQPSRRPAERRQRRQRRSASARRRVPRGSGERLRAPWNRTSPRRLPTRSPRSSTSTSPQVDVIFTGHTHQAYVYNAPVTGGSLPTRPVLQTGNYADHVGKVVLTVDDQTGAVVVVDCGRTCSPAAAANLSSATRREGRPDRQGREGAGRHDRPATDRDADGVDHHRLHRWHVHGPGRDVRRQRRSELEDRARRPRSRSRRSGQLVAQHAP